MVLCLLGQQTRTGLGSLLLACMLQTGPSRRAPSPAALLTAVLPPKLCCCRGMWRRRRAAAHRDFGPATLIWAGGEGLEVK